MRDQLKLLLRLSIFWLMVFTVNRLIFLLYYSDLLNVDGIEFSEIMGVFYYSLKLDLSTISYLLAFVFLLSLFFRGYLLKTITKVFTLICLAFYLLVSNGELQLYGEWKTKLSAKAILYLKEPSEVLGSATNKSIVISVVLFIVSMLVFSFILNKLIGKLKPILFKKNEKKFTITYLIIAPIIIFLLIRGGFQAIPITASQSYYSKHDILNITSVNPAYNIIFSIIDYGQVNSRNIFKTIDEDVAFQLVKDLHHIEKDTTIKILNVKKPNVVIILLESWSADMIESLGGDSLATPEFHKLEKEGLLFTEFYATANRSQQAMASLYSGLPGLPITTLTDHPEKYPSVASMVKTLNQEEYSTSFTFGGQLIYGNMKSYFVFNEFDLLVEQGDISEDYPEGKLGIHDEFMFEYFENQINGLEAPFFSGLFTLSSHSPYDFPGPKPLNHIELENDFINSVHYTDKWLGHFFSEAKQKAYWDSTLFIVMADHSHNTHKNHPIWSFDYRKIPLIMLGGALKEEYQGEQNSQICSNVDITTTILKQLGLDADEFFWSKNIFNPYTKEFAYFELNEGFGWKTTQGEFVLDIKNNRILHQNAEAKDLKTLELQGRAYLQHWFNEFMEY